MPQALCPANEVAVAMEAGPEAESFVNANGSDWSKSSAAVVLETCSIDGALLVKTGYRLDLTAPSESIVWRPQR